MKAFLSLLLCVNIILSKSDFAHSHTCQAAFFIPQTTTKSVRTKERCFLKKMQSDSDTALLFQESSNGDEECRQGQIPMEKDTSLQAKALNLNLMEDDNPMEVKNDTNPIKNFFAAYMETSKGGPPPMQIEDTSLLLYDIFLILNLSVSISFWVVHRLSFVDIIPAFSEGSLLCILWVIAGLWNGAFLYSAADGHYDPKTEENAGGPTSAAMLGLSTFITTANLRILVALGTAVLEHRKVGVTNGEELIPLEIAFGLMLMSAWRMLHSSYTRV